MRCFHSTLPSLHSESQSAGGLSTQSGTAVSVSADPLSPTAKPLWRLPVWRPQRPVRRWTWRVPGRLSNSSTAAHRPRRLPAAKWRSRQRRLCCGRSQRWPLDSWAAGTPSTATTCPSRGLCRHTKDAPHRATSRRGHCHSLRWTVGWTWDGSGSNRTSYYDVDVTCRAALSCE